MVQFLQLFVFELCTSTPFDGDITSILVGGQETPPQTWAQQTINVPQNASSMHIFLPLWSYYVWVKDRDRSG